MAARWLAANATSLVSLLLVFLLFVIWAVVSAIVDSSYQTEAVRLYLGIGIALLSACILAPRIYRSLQRSTQHRAYGMLSGCILVIALIMFGAAHSCEIERSITETSGYRQKYDPEWIYPIPTFPWPPPSASATQLVPRALIIDGRESTPNLEEVATRLSNALDGAGYFERSFFAVPDGFAMVTRLEQINSDGTPREGDERWITEFSPSRDFTLKSCLAALFNARVGYYRVIVFVISPHAFSESNVVVTRQEAMSWLRTGYNKLPRDIASQAYAPEYDCTALIYEFDQPEYQKAGSLLIPGRLSGMTHLQRAKVWDALAR